MGLHRVLLTNFRFKLILKEGWWEVYTILPTGWVHAVMVFHGTHKVSNGVTAYVDKTFLRSDPGFANTTGNGLTDDGDGLVEIGTRRDNTGAHRHISLYMDEVKMYNRALSTDEVHQMY